MPTMCEAVNDVADELVREILANEHPMFQLQVALSSGPVKAVSYMLLKNEVLTIIAAAAIQLYADKCKSVQ